MASYEIIGKKMSIRTPEETDIDIIRELTANAIFSKDAAFHIVTSNKTAQVIAVAITDKNVLTTYTRKNEIITFTNPGGEKADVSGLLNILH